MAKSFFEHEADPRDWRWAIPTGIFFGAMSVYWYKDWGSAMLKGTELEQDPLFTKLNGLVSGWPGALVSALFCLLFLYYGIGVCCRWPGCRKKPAPASPGAGDRRSIAE
jgi:hypothetical protein